MISNDGRNVGSISEDGLTVCRRKEDGGLEVVFKLLTPFDLTTAVAIDQRSDQEKIDPVLNKLDDGGEAH